jgi:hypothetical protein
MESRSAIYSSLLCALKATPRTLKQHPHKSPHTGRLASVFRGLEARKRLKTLAPQVGLEPTTLRLTATGAGPKSATDLVTTGSHLVRCVLTGHTVGRISARPPRLVNSVGSLLAIDRFVRRFIGSRQRFPKVTARCVRLLLEARERPPKPFTSPSCPLIGRPWTPRAARLVLSLDG